MPSDPTTSPAASGPAEADGVRDVDPTAVRRPRRSWPQRLLLSFGTLASVTALLAASVAGYAAWKLRGIERTDVTLDQVVDGGPRNYLVVGSDTRSGGDPTDPEAKDDHRPLADTIMILRIDPAEQTAMVLSLPRDLWVTNAGTGKEGRINAAYATGHQQLIDTLRDELEIPIHHYLEVDFKGFQQVVNAIDGVPLWFDRAMRDRNSGLDVLHPGCTTLDGYGALAFARARHLEYYESGGFDYDGSGDLGRISRQQLLLRRVISRARSKGLHNPLTLKRLVDVGAANVTIDGTLPAGELLSLAKRFSDFDPDELLTYTLPTSPRTTSGGAKVEDLDVAQAQPLLAMFRDPPEPGAPSSTTTAAAFGFDQLAAPGSVRVDVYNSAGRQGLAVEVADALVARGFEVGSWGNGTEVGHPLEGRSVVRFGPGGDQVEVQARTVAAWVTGGADVEADPSLPTGSVALFLGGNWDGLTRPTPGSVAASASASSTAGSPSTTAPATPIPATVPPSSEVVGMVPLGDPPPGRTCG